MSNNYIFHIKQRLQYIKQYFLFSSALYHSLNLSCELILYRSAIILADFTIQFRQAKSQKYIQRCSFRLHAYPVVGADIFFTSLLSLFIRFFCSRQGGRGWGIRAKNTGGTSNWKHLIAFSLFLSFVFFFKSIYFDAQKLNLCFVLICTQSSYVERKETLLFFFETSQNTLFHMALQSLQGSKLITMRYKSRAFRFFDFFLFSFCIRFFSLFFAFFRSFWYFCRQEFYQPKRPAAVLFCIFLVYHVSM